MKNPESIFPLLEASLKKINLLKAENINEANTRLQIVDDILLYLGWSKSEFSPEEPTGIGNYTDYIFKVNGVHHLVVEAKRLGKTFILPEKINKREYKCSYLVNGCGSDLKDAMNQAAQYCNEKGAPYAVVTNGDQWIIFKGLATAQKGWIDNKAIVFNSSEFLKQNFSEFWNILSKERVINGSLPEKLGFDTAKNPNFAKRPNFETENHIVVGKTPLKDVDLLFNYYFDDIVSRDGGKMLTECYVEENEVKEYRRELQSLLKDRLLSLGEEVETEELTEQDLTEAIETSLPDERAKVVLLVGHIGAGKSTFLKRYFGKQEQERGYAKFIFDILNDGNPSGKVRENETELISKFILNQISDYYYKKNNFGSEYDPLNHDTLYNIFFGTIRKIKEGAKRDLYLENPNLLKVDIAERLDEESKNYEQLLPLYLKYIYKRKKSRPFCLIFDNVDRASDEYQEFIYNFAHSLAKYVPGVIIISLRETTFHRAKKKGFLDTRASDKVFQLHAPDIKRVISRRLRYLSYQIDDPNKRAAKGVRNSLHKIEPIAEHLKNLLLLEDNSARELLVSISNRSVRVAFKLLRQYALSPFAWEEFQDESAGQHLLRGLMLSRQVKYIADESHIVNLFAVPAHNQVSHFTMLKILAFLYWKYQKDKSFKESPKVIEVLSVFESMRISRSYVRDALTTLINAELIECDGWYISNQTEPDLFEKIEGDLSNDYHIRITATGYYYLNSLANNKLYVALCSQDSIWYSQEFFEPYIEEYKEFIKVAKDNPEYDFLSGTTCPEIWLRYLGIERFYEEKLLNESVDSNWWKLAFQFIETVIPTDEENSLIEKENAKKTDKKAKEIKPTLWKE